MGFAWEKDQKLRSITLRQSGKNSEELTDILNKKHILAHLKCHL